MTQPDTAGILAPPPLLTVACVLAGFVAERFVSLPLAPWSTGVRVGISVAILLAAGVLFLAAVRQLHRHATTPNPYQPSTAVVSSGVYRFTRNPIYVAFMAVVLGLAVAGNSVWLLVALAVLFALLHFGVVKREERYLAAKFGPAYDTYRARVRRWL
ncbi:MAG TPA: isoprenylcysteine carboxylmethyltransferase family protein [Thermoanaerobaculia bacterium]|nr:isoprenylcysteine carboxylmethyltransferase family protein [Thermoanaerobaculia bacterium]